MALFRVRKQLSHQLIIYLFIDLVVNPRKQGIYAYRHWQCNTEKECQKTGASADDNKDYQYAPKNYTNHSDTFNYMLFNVSPVSKSLHNPAKETKNKNDE